MNYISPSRALLLRIGLIASMMSTGCSGSDPSNPNSGGGGGGNSDAAFLLDFEGNNVGQWESFPVDEPSSWTNTWEKWWGSGTYACNVEFTEIRTRHLIAGVIDGGHNSSKCLRVKLTASGDVRYTHLQGSCYPFDFSTGDYYSPEALDESLIGPPMDLTSATYGDSIWVSFWFKPISYETDESSYSDLVQIEFQTYAGLVFEPTKGFFDTNRNEWQYVEFDISRYAGTWDKLWMEIRVSGGRIRWDYIDKLGPNVNDPGGEVNIEFLIDEIKIRVKKG